METRYLLALTLFSILLASSTSFAQDFFAVRDLFNNIACNVVCVIEYMILALCAAVIVLSGARYMSSDDPSVRVDMRKNLEYAIIGLVLVFAGIPAVNTLANQTKSPFYCVSCSPDAELFRVVAETFSCNLICLIQIFMGALLALTLITSGILYLVSGEDPKSRHNALDRIKNAFVGLMIVIVAVPVLNYLSEGTGTELSCECIPEGDAAEQIVSVISTFLCILAWISPPVCALAVAYGGLRYVTSADDPGARDAAKTVVIGALTGMIIVMLAVPMVNTVLSDSFEQVTFDCSEGDVATEITGIFCNFLCFISFIVPSICALVVVYGGLKYITSGDDPGARKTAQTIIISAFIGMIIVFLAVHIVNIVLTEAFDQVVCDCTESDSVTQVLEILCKFICLIMSIAPAIAALMAVYGGLKYITSGEDPEARKAAKTLIISAFIGLVIVLVALAVVSMAVSEWSGVVECGCFSYTQQAPNAPTPEPTIIPIPESTPTITPAPSPSPTPAITPALTPEPTLTECQTACAGSNYKCADSAPSGYVPAAAGDQWCSSLQNSGTKGAHCYCEGSTPSENPTLVFLPAESSTSATVGSTGGIILKYKATDFPSGSVITYSAGTSLTVSGTPAGSIISTSQTLEVSYTCNAEGEVKVTVTIKTSSKDYTDEQTVTCGRASVNVLDIVLVPMGYNLPAEKAEFEEYGDKLRQNWIDETPFKNCPNNVAYHFLETDCPAAKTKMDSCDINGAYTELLACANAGPEGRIYDKIQGVYKGDMGDACKGDMAGVSTGQIYSIVSAKTHKVEKGAGSFAFNTNDLSEVTNLNNGLVSSQLAALFSAQGLTPPSYVKKKDETINAGTSQAVTNTKWVSYLNGANKGIIYSILKQDNHLSIYLGERFFLFNLDSSEETNLDSGSLSADAQRIFSGMIIGSGSQRETLVPPTSIRKVGENWEGDYSISGKSSVYTFVKEGGKIVVYISGCDIDTISESTPEIGTHELAHSVGLCTGSQCTTDTQGKPTYHCSIESCIMYPTTSSHTDVLPPACNNPVITYEAKHFCKDCMKTLKTQLAPYLTGCTT